MKTVMIDGSHGEGGGQILRSALTLSMITARPVEIFNIRSRRTRPGLRPQHLTSVRAAAAVCGAEVEGAEINSEKLRFAPGRISNGKFRFEIETAGSVMLVFQTVLLPLALADGASEVVLKGGTHVSWSPCFHYVDTVFRQALYVMGITFELVIERWGWYPKGGGVVRARISPVRAVRPLRMPEDVMSVPRVSALSAASGLPLHVIRRQAARVRSLLGKRNVPVVLKEHEAPALCPGSLVFCWIAGRERLCGFSALGARGKPAEKVADEAVAELFRFLESGTNIDRRLSDQLLIPAVLADGQSCWSTDAVTAHMHTNVWVARQFEVGKVEITEDDAGRGRVVCHGSGFP